jgi:hypothetical protein
LSFNQCPDLTYIPKTEFVDLTGENFKGYQATRSKKQIYDSEFTAVLIFVEFSLNTNKFENIKDNVLGKSIFFTDNDNWSTETKISAYHSQYHVEQCFRQMK